MASASVRRAANADQQTASRLGVTAMRSWLLVSLLLGLGSAVLSPAAPAHAHARLTEATPSAGAVLATTPPRLQLLIDEELDEDQSEVRVTGPLGQRADRQDQQV